MFAHAHRRRERAAATWFNQRVFQLFDDAAVSPRVSLALVCAVSVLEMRGLIRFTFLPVARLLLSSLVEIEMTL